MHLLAQRTVWWTPSTVLIISLIMLTTVFAVLISESQHGSGRHLALCSQSGHGSGATECWGERPEGWYHKRIDDYF
jgi:hypothetical protein